MFYGSIVAIITAMDSEGYLDKAKYAELVDWHLSEGTDGIVVGGTTGEAPTLSEAELLDLIEFTVSRVKGNIPVIAGTGTNCTAKTIRLSEQAMELGVDACLVVSPYYNKPTQEGLYKHFRTVAENVATPFILYNHPGRTGVDILPETVNRLADISNIVGIKEALGKVERVKELVGLCDGRINVLSGDDALTIDMMKVGAKGVISVAANVVPKLMHELCLAANNGDMKTAIAINEKLVPLYQALNCETNPIPVKWALHHIGKIDSGIRLPLTTLSKQYHAEVTDALKLVSV